MKQVEYDCIKAIDVTIKSKGVDQEVARCKLVSIVTKLVEAEQLPQSALDEYLRSLSLDADITAAESLVNQTRFNATRVAAQAQAASAAADRELQRLQVQRARIIDGNRVGASRAAPTATTDSCGHGGGGRLGDC